MSVIVVTSGESEYEVVHKIEQLAMHVSPVLGEQLQAVIEVNRADVVLREQVRIAEEMDAVGKPLFEATQLEDLRRRLAGDDEA